MIILKKLLAYSRSGLSSAPPNLPHQCHVIQPFPELFRSLEVWLVQCSHVQVGSDHPPVESGMASGSAGGLVCWGHLIKFFHTRPCVGPLVSRSTKVGQWPPHQLGYCKGMWGVTLDTISSKWPCAGSLAWGLLGACSSRTLLYMKGCLEMFTYLVQGSIIITFTIKSRSLWRSAWAVKGTLH